MKRTGRACGSWHLDCSNMHIVSLAVAVNEWCWPDHLVGSPVYEDLMVATDMSGCEEILVHLQGEGVQ